ncbi:hypothetical protein TKK_0005295 [Trichogramma kaykai]
MESSDTLNYATRVKEEPSDEPLIGNDFEVNNEQPDLKNFQVILHPREKSTYTLQKSEGNHDTELDDEVEIVVELMVVKLKP